MNTIKVVFERDRVLLDENNEVITYQMLPENTQRLFHSGMNGYNMDYYNEIFDSYYDHSYYESGAEGDKMFQEWCLISANDLKKQLPETTVLFRNTNKYYDLPTNEESFSEIQNHFDISTVILNKERKYLKVMFDWEATGVWGDYGDIELDWIPVRQETRNLIAKFQKGMDSMDIDYDSTYTQAQKEQKAAYILMSLQAAIELKEQLPDWTIFIDNGTQYFDLPLVNSDPYALYCSEIQPGLKLEDVKIHENVDFPA